VSKKPPTDQLPTSQQFEIRGNIQGLGFSKNKQKFFYSCNLLFLVFYFSVIKKGAQGEQVFTLDFQ